MASIRKLKQDLQMQLNALGGDIILKFAETTSTKSATTGTITKVIECRAEDSQGRVHEWLTATYTTKVSVATDSDTGTVSVASSSIAFVNGYALIVLTGATTADVAGYQQITVGGAKNGASATGLANDATAYTATMVIDGVSKAISVVGSAAQTYTTLIAEINTDLAGAATAAISGGNLRVTSATTGTSSTVAITDGTLCAALTSFTAIASAVAGITADFDATETITVTVADITVLGYTVTGGTHVITITT